MRQTLDMCYVDGSKPLPYPTIRHFVVYARNDESLTGW